MIAALSEGGNGTTLIIGFTGEDCAALLDSEDAGTALAVDLRLMHIEHIDKIQIIGAVDNDRLMARIAPLMDEHTTIHGEQNRPG